MGLTFGLGYAIPLIIMVVLLGVALMYWLRRHNVPLTTAVVSAQTTTVSTRPGATRIVVAVVVVFAILQLPLKVL